MPKNSKDTLKKLVMQLLMKAFLICYKMSEQMK